MVTQRTRGKKGEGHETDTIGETNSAEDAGNRRSTPDSEAHAVRQITAKGEWKARMDAAVVGMTRLEARATLARMAEDMVMWAEEKNELGRRRSETWV